MDKRKEANLHVKNSIVSALIDLMREKNFEAISVSEITAAPEFPVFPITGILTAKKTS